jgi:hypothetical protein
MWQQNYESIGDSLALSALVASISIAVLFFMLGVLPVATPLTYPMSESSLYPVCRGGRQS